MSTISPAPRAALPSDWPSAGRALLDAPVTGGDVGAENATLTIMVGGDAEAFARARPILEHLGKHIVHVGPSGSGQLLKACNQILCAVNMIAVCEALTLARQSGLDLRASAGDAGHRRRRLLGLVEPRPQDRQRRP
jgi:3-hydroxyisobutyrate dehydrogenase-like beta-hydroxyacid dehydrogenase